MSSATEAGTDRLAGLLAEHAALETELADPAVHPDQTPARRPGRPGAPLPPTRPPPAAWAAGTPASPPSSRPRAPWTPPATTSRPPASWAPRTPPSPPRP